jgi:class 3 adenylate cyclase/tetratricopeptide (TPR) repeat protein
MSGGAVGSGMVRVCSACGSENPEGHRFCGSCAAALSAPVVERRKLATSVFCDLSGSTELGDQVDAETVFELMRSYFDEARAALERHGGSVEKFIGDAVVGMFGVPEAHEDDALRACRAALEIQERIAVLNEELVARYGSGIAVRVGVNTGEVVAGDAARREMFASGDAVVLGDSVNVAARLEQAASPGEVLVGEATYRLVHAGVRVEAVPPIVVKGKSGPVIAFRLRDVSRLGPLPRGAGAALVGREAELALLKAEFEAVTAEGRCRLVTVVGEPGVGKSRLASELIASLAPHAHAVRGACLSYGEGITYWPIAQIVRELAGIRDDDSAEDARERVPTRIAQLLGLAEGTTTADQMSLAIVEFLAAAAAREPLVLLVDDIHWAEPALLALLGSLPRFIEDAPILLLCLARAELLEARPEWPVTVPLQPLDAADLDALLDDLSAPPAMREQIAKTAAGNPLFAEELVAWVIEGGDLTEMPTSLNALLGARLDRLEPAARDALERGAVEGEVFHQGAVVELSDERSRPAIGDELGLLARKDLIRLAAASLVVGGAAYRFKHILVREAAYLATTKKARASLHERFADWLEQLVGDRVGEYHEILGYHLEQAYRYRTELSPLDDHARTLAARAGRRLGAAGLRANDRGDVRAGANLLARATGLLPPEGVERLELLLPYAYAVRESRGRSGAITESNAIYDELYQRATTLGDRRLAAHARLHRTESWFASLGGADPDSARAVYEELIATFEELGDQVGLAQTKRIIGMRCRGQRWAEAVAWMEQALVHANACGDQPTRRTVTQSLGGALTRGPTPVDYATNRCEELLEQNRDDRELAAAIMRQLGLLYAMAGRFEDAREYESRAARVLEESRIATTSFAYLTVSADTKVLLGDRAGAERDIRQKWQGRSERGAEGAQPLAIAVTTAGQLANFYCDEGRWDEAEACLAAYPGYRLGSSGDMAEARLKAHRGEHDEALELARSVVEHEDQTDQLNAQARMRLCLAEVQRAAGRDEDAARSVARAIELYELKGNVAAADQVLAATT